jgi:pilus assembly protein CpaE
MHGIAVSLLAQDKERLTVLQNRLEASQMGRNVFSHTGFPASPTDPILRQIQDVRSEVVLVDLEPERVQAAIRAIELIHNSTEEIVIIAVGPLIDPSVIVSAMRAGAREYLERNAPVESMVEALARFSAARTKSRAASGRARVFTITNAKGGAGATTVAVNTAIALEELHGSVLLVDFAPLGHVSLHLNARPAFGIADALQNLHRLDQSLLQGLLTTYKGGMQFLAGPQEPYTATPTAAELSRLFDLLVSQFRYVIVDCSNRMDQTARLLADLSNTVLLVAQTDVVSLWSAGRMRSFLEEGGGRDRVRLVLNRYKKIPGFGDEDVEAATSCKLLWKVPNNFQSISPAIDKGQPIAFQEHIDVARSYRGLASLMAEASAKLEAKAKASGSLIISPLRAGQ